MIYYIIVIIIDTCIDIIIKLLINIEEFIIGI